MPEATIPHRVVPGNRPTTVILAERLDPADARRARRPVRAQRLCAGRDLGRRPLRPVGGRARQGARSTRIAPELAADWKHELQHDSSTNALSAAVPDAAGWLTPLRQRSSSATPEGAFPPGSRSGSSSQGILRRGWRGARSGCLSRLRVVGETDPPSTRVPSPPPEPCGPLPLAACAVRSLFVFCFGVDNDPRGEGLGGGGEPTWTESEYAAAVDRVRTAIERGDVYQVNLVQHLQATRPGDPATIARSLAAALAPFRALLRRIRWVGEGVGDRVRVARALPLAQRAAGCRRCRSRERGPKDVASEFERVGEGCRGACHDRRPRTERSLARVRAGIGALAGAHGDPQARGSRAHGVHGRGDAS